MSPRSSVAPVVASGTASVVKLLVATLAFTGAYVGVEASHNASVQAAPASVTTRTTQTRTTQTRTTPARIVRAQTVGTRAVSLPTESKSESSTAARAAVAGAITVAPLAGSRPCEKTYLVQSVIDNPRPESAVSYGWRLQRWSPATRNWRTYMITNSGFAGRSRSAKWQPSVIDNPGWYRAELSVSGGARLHSGKFLVSC
ncbi:hypothetical protein FHR32_000986 [Streptosporangium album]|uniref:Uncharacterized protein n=1 Tax=Streptosporangium album TaxID=47479 RepID=A0A7W7RR60_9ACTN|nr:hypothetical protein [Streptosporangium album]MBB4936681.1 hypothetical protein [Streptosporangium album]